MDSSDAENCSGDESPCDVRYRELLREVDPVASHSVKLPPPVRCVASQTDEDVPQCLADKLSRSLVTFDDAMRRCFDVGDRGEPRPNAFSEVDKMRAQLDRESDNFRATLKRLRVTEPTEPQIEKRVCVEPIQAGVERPQWADELKQVVESLSRDVSTSSITGHHDGSMEQGASLGVLFQPPPSIQIHSVRSDRSSSEASVNETHSPGQDFPCHSCADVQVILKKEKGSSILNLYGELKRLREERQQVVLENTKALSAHLQSQRNLASQIARQVERGLRFHHNECVNRCYTLASSLDSKADHAGLSLTQLQKDVDSLQKLRRQLEDTLCDPPIRFRGKTAEDLTLAAANFSVSSLLMEVDALQKKVSEYKESAKEDQRKLVQWKEKYHVASLQLAKEPEERGYVRSDAAQLLLASHTEQYRAAIRTLGWEVKELSNHSMVLVNCVSGFEKQVSLQSSTIDGKEVPSVPLALARHVFEAAKAALSERSISETDASAVQSSVQQRSPSAPPVGTQSEEGLVSSQVAQPLPECVVSQEETGLSANTAQVAAEDVSFSASNELAE